MMTPDALRAAVAVVQHEVDELTLRISGTTFPSARGARLVQWRDAIACVLAAVPVWRDIATAPKDGTWILAWMRSPWSHHEQVRWLVLDDGIQFWQAIGDHARPDQSQLTHWMPLPEAPDETGQRD
jgi:hypothetical protein